MRGPNRPQRTAEQLYPLRVALRALEAVIDQLDLASVAIKLNPDDTSQAWQFLDGTIGFSEDFRERWHVANCAALVVLDLVKARATVTIPRVAALVRRHHLAALDERPDLERADGLGPDVGPLEVDVGDVIRLDGPLLRTAPARPPPVRRPRSTPVSRRAFGR